MMNKPSFIFACSIVSLLLSSAISAQKTVFNPKIFRHDGPTTSIGTASALGSFSSTYEPWNAFVDSEGMWISEANQSPTWIQYEFSGPKRTVRGYKLYHINGSHLTTRAPKKFKFQVFKNTFWKTVDTRCCETKWSSGEERTYELSDDVRGTKFRILFQDDNDKRPGVVAISLRRIQLL